MKTLGNQPAKLIATLQDERRSIFTVDDAVRILDSPRRRPGVRSGRGEQIHELVRRIAALTKEERKLLDARAGPRPVRPPSTRRAGYFSLNPIKSSSSR
jgi:hypothetical protein